MKRYYLVVIMVALLPSMALAQLKVNSGGHVGIGNGGNDQSKLSVTSNNSTGINNFGILSVASNNSNATVGCTVGVNGCAIGKNGYTYGVIGRNLGSYYQSSNHFGTGILGIASLSHGIPYIEGYYAGYFVGNVKVTGTIDGTLVTSSDGRLKENVQPLVDENVRGEGALAKLGLLTPVSYNYKDTTTAKPKNDQRAKIDKKNLTEEDEEFWDESFDEEDVEETNQVMEKRHFGFIAQELQEVYPDLVYQKDDGYLAVNYTELIPILVQSIKELNEKVEMLSNNKTKQSMAAKSGGNFAETANVEALDFSDMATMNQNVPNPFSEKTDIAIYLPETVQTATLYIYDLSGKQLEQHPIKGRGNTVMTIHADRMDAGMYVYSLIADKKVVTTKKMIVTK